MVAFCLQTTNLQAAAPTILSISPASGSTVSSLSQVTVTFSTPVVGVQGSDLQINDQPALAANVTNASVTFQFSQPPGGLVAMNFDSDAVFTDLTGNLFDTLAPGAAWTYTLADILPPIVAIAEPAAGAVAGTLSQIEVSFNEAVSGVDASDLIINGAAATGVTSLAADRYRFDFPTAAPGAANITWAAGHGIRISRPPRMRSQERVGRTPSIPPHQRALSSAKFSPKTAPALTTRMTRSRTGSSCATPATPR